jgi:hypothetical protein
MNKEIKTVTPTALEGHFKVVGVVPGLINVPHYGNVDLRHVSLEMAEKLHVAGCPYLVRDKK